MRNFLAKRYQDLSMTSMSEAAAKQGDYINLSIGDVDLITDEYIIRSAMNDAMNGHTHYTNPKGDPELIKAIRDYCKDEYGDDASEEEVLVTTSSGLGMSQALMAIIDEGDEIIVFGPYYPVYKDQIEQAGGICVEVGTYANEQFEIDKERLLSAVSERTKAIIFNNPCNPTGKVYGRKTYDLLSEVAIEKDLLILADEIYTFYMFDKNIPFIPMRSIPGMKERTISINSFSKNYMMTGWRIGYALAPKELIDAMAIISDNLVYSAPSISQRAAIAALKSREKAKKDVNVFKERMDYCADRLNAMGWCKVDKPQGAFYLFPDITRTGLNSVEFCEKARREANVILLPGTTFGESGKGHIRIACTQSKEILEEAMKRLEKLEFKAE